MKKMGRCVAFCFTLLFLMAGCGRGVSESGVFSAPAQSSSPPPSATISQPMQGSAFINRTADMTFEVEGKTCVPGASVALTAPLTAFVYATAAYEREQAFFDIAEVDLGYIRVEAAQDEAGRYTLAVYAAYDESEAEPEMEYMLIPEGLYWMRCDPSQLLYMADLPQMPMDELLDIYPDAVLPLGHKEVEWPGGYVYMLWCYEPLYNVKISSTSVLDVVDGEILYGYVDWDAVESTELTPGAPLFTDIVSVGSMWELAVRFEDGQGIEYIYLAGENGKGGDRPGLILRPIDGRILSQAETEAIHEQRQQEAA